MSSILLIAAVCLSVMPLRAQSTVDGLSIPSRPAQGGMVLWTPARLAQAKAWYGAHPFTPKLSNSLYLPWTDILFHHVVTGNTADCSAAYAVFGGANMIPVDPLKGYIAANQTRWYGEWQVLTYDWCYDALSDAQRKSLASTINTWMTVMMGPNIFPGNRKAPYNNYFWGDVRNELEWGLASYNDQPAQAKVFLDDVLASSSGRWDIFKADAMAAEQSGVAIEGSQYGKYQLWYTLLPFTAAKDYGRDLFQETRWFKDSVFYLIYSTTDALTTAKGLATPIWQTTSFNDDQQWFNPYVGGALSPLGNGTTGSYYGEFLLYAANAWGGDVGGYAQQWLNTVQPKYQSMWHATENTNAVTPISFASLALDFNAPGPQMSWSRSSWGGTTFYSRFGGSIGSGHYHRDSGTFDLWSNGKFITRESTGYSDIFAGWKGAGTVNSQDTLVHNSIVFNGRGQSVSPAGPATTRRLQSAADYFYSSADLTNTYICPGCRKWNVHPERDNLAVQHAEREFIFLRASQTLIVFDRMLSTGAADVKTAPLECETQWTVEDGAHFRCDDEAATLRVSSLIAPASYRVIDETACAGCSKAGQSRLEQDQTGRTLNYSLNVLQSRKSSDPNVIATLADSNPSDPTVGTFTVKVGPATIILQKGTVSAGGSVNGAPLREDVQPMTMTDQGPQWGSGPGTSPPPPVDPPPPPGTPPPPVTQPPVTPPPANSAHPRVLLNASVLATLAQKAAANDPTWTALKSFCDQNLTAPVVTPDAIDPGSSAISAGFGGTNYFHHVMAQGLCYQTLSQTDPGGAATYGKKLVSILLAMSDPGHQSAPGTTQPLYTENGGYDIRNYGVGMALGYDWAYNLMSAAQRQQVYNALNQWIDAWDSGEIAQYAHPQSSYYAGYYNAKALTALATTEDNPQAATYWSDWYNKEHLQRVQPWYQAYLSGGGWPEGFMNYGGAAINQAMPVIAVNDIQGVDLVNSAQAPYSFPKNMAKYLMYFTWPSLTRMYDEDAGHMATSYAAGTPFIGTFQFFSYLSQYLNDPMAPQFHHFVSDTAAAVSKLYPNAPNVNAPEWSGFLFWNAKSPDASYRNLPLSYWAQGIDQVAARSDWTTSANWWMLRAERYINSPVQAQQMFAAGEISAVHGGTPLLVNPNAWLLQTSPGEANVNTDAHGAAARRTYANTFQVFNPSNPGDLPNQTAGYPPAVGTTTLGTGKARTTISAYDEGSRYTLATARYLEDQYRGFASPDCGPVTSWTRQVIHLRPARVVIYDRTGICNVAYTQIMAWHTPAVPVKVAQSQAIWGVTRLDVSYKNNFAGSMIFVAPSVAKVATSDLDGEGLVYRTQVTPAAPSANTQWLTVLDMSASSGAVAQVKPFWNSQHTMTGVIMTSGGSTEVVLMNAGAAGTTVPLAGYVSYYMPVGNSTDVLAELPANTRYRVLISASGGYQTVTVTANAAGSFTTTANGTLSFAISASGAATP
ncbi:MAG: hypothetical protein ABI383_04755 [Acidobacteriaceae bacterium]